MLETVVGNTFIIPIGWQLVQLLSFLFRKEKRRALWWSQSALEILEHLQSFLPPTFLSPLCCIDQSAILSPCSSLCVCVIAQSVSPGRLLPGTILRETISQSRTFWRWADLASKKCISAALWVSYQSGPTSTQIRTKGEILNGHLEVQFEGSWHLFLKGQDVQTDCVLNAREKGIKKPHGPQGNNEKMPTLALEYSCFRIQISKLPLWNLMDLRNKTFLMILLFDFLELFNQGLFASTIYSHSSQRREGCLSLFGVAGHGHLCP